MPQLKHNAAPDPVDVLVGLRIRLRRRELGITQAQLAAAMGLTFQQVQKYELGGNRICASRLVRAAAVLGVTAAWLAGEGGARLDITMAPLLAQPGGDELLRVWRRLPPAKRRLLLTVARTLARSAKS